MAWNFQYIVIVAAVLILIITLVVAGFSLRKAQTSAPWPPVIPECPDYWTDLSGNGTGCANLMDLGTCPSYKDGLPHSFAGFTNCQKLSMANDCHITWDGITTNSMADFCSK